MAARTSAFRNGLNMFVLVRFKSITEGGRTKPPFGTYTTAAKVIGKHIDDVYSLRLWDIPKNITTEETILLKADAICPDEFKLDDEFKMFEGSKVVAEGRVVPDKHQ